VDSQPASYEVRVEMAKSLGCLGMHYAQSGKLKVAGELKDQMAAQVAAVYAVDPEGTATRRIGAYLRRLERRIASSGQASSGQ
jgi:hypothetical protein